MILAKFNEYDDAVFCAKALADYLGQRYKADFSGACRNWLVDAGKSVEVPNDYPLAGEAYAFCQGYLAGVQP